MSDFGLKERFVASMKGVALSQDPQLNIHDLTHQINPFDIEEAAFTLYHTLPYWPEQTVFVSVVDPGVGTIRKSIVAQLVTNQLVVTPDNGTITLLEQKPGILQVREIDENLNRLPGSDNYHTFHGRDVYVYTGARLAAGQISFDQTGPLLKAPWQKLNLAQPIMQEHSIIGAISKVEHPYGNLVTNIPEQLMLQLFKPGDKLLVEVLNQEKTRLKQVVALVSSFGQVGKDELLIYIDSVGYAGLALNSNNLATKQRLEAGNEWTIKLSRIPGHS